VSSSREIIEKWGPRLLWLIILGYLVSSSYSFLWRFERVQSGLSPGITEFTSTYGASMLLRDHPAGLLYTRDAMHEYKRRAVIAMYPTVDRAWLAEVRYPPFLYPPHYVLLIAPLVLLPYWWAHIAWIMATGGIYLAAMTRILRTSLALPLALAAPPVFYNAFQGQSGFLIAGSIGLGLAMLPTRPVIAGILIGVASVKPHFGILVPIALVAGGYWRTIAASCLTVSVMILLSIALLGLDAWQAYLDSAQANLQGFETQTYQYIPMTTVLSSMAMFGIELPTARLIQYLSFISAMSLVAWVWWRGKKHPETLGLQAAILCLATPLALPMAYIYDLVLIVPAIAWLGINLWNKSERPWDWAMLLLPTSLLLAVVTVADTFKVQIGCLLLLVLLALACHRYQLEVTAQSDR
jgi:hypothetical protein